jgi:thymidylate synthase
MNMFALVQLQQKIANRIAELSDRTVKIGRYVHQADSYHIYGSYFKTFEERFINALQERTFEQRTFPYIMAKEMMDAAIPSILEKAKKMGERVE